MRLWWWRKVRKAHIPKPERDLFERFGENVMGSLLTGGLQPQSAELQAISYKQNVLAHAADWLTERSDAREQREQRLETAEGAILIVVLLEVIADLARLG